MPKSATSTLALPGEQDILRLDVAVHDPLGMGVAQRGGDLPADPQRVREVELPLPGHPGPERLALDVGHGVVGQPVGGARVEQRQDVGVLEPGGDLDFAEEALRPQRLGQGGMQHLERDRARVPKILGQVHRGHAPAAQLALQHVAVR